MITIFPEIVLSGQNKKATLRKFDGTRNILSWIVLTQVQQLQSHLCTVFSYIGLYNSKYTHVQCWHNGSYSPKRTYVQCYHRYLLKLHRSLFSQITLIHYVVIKKFLFIQITHTQCCHIHSVVILKSLFTQFTHIHNVVILKSLFSQMTHIHNVVILK